MNNGMWYTYDQDWNTKYGDPFWSNYWMPWVIIAAYIIGTYTVLLTGYFIYTVNWCTQFENTGKARWAACQLPFPGSAS